MTGKELGEQNINSDYIDDQNNQITYYSHSGLTKREYFAGLFMQSLLSNPERYKYIAELVDNCRISQEQASQKNAHKAVLLADALLEELSKE